MLTNKLPYAIKEFVKSQGRVSYPDLLVFFHKFGFTADDISKAVDFLLEQCEIWEPVAGEVELI